VRTQSACSPDEPLENAPSGQVAETQNTEVEEEADPFERGRGGEMGRGGMSMGSMGGGRGGRFGGRSGPGTFTVATSDKRSILVNTTTGASWQLIIDNPGSHWEPIVMGVSKGGRLEISWSAAPAGAADVQPAAPSEKREARMLEQSEKHVRRLNNALEMETERSRDLEKSVTLSNLEVRRLTDGLFKYRDEVAELKKQLKEANKLLNARPQPAPPQPTSTSEETNPFEGS
jgi:hypothetical protein